MLADAELERVIKLLDYLEKSHYPDIYSVCVPQSVSTNGSSDPGTAYLLLCLHVKLLKAERVPGPIDVDLFRHYLWRADEIDDRLKGSFAAVLKELFELGHYDFNHYRAIRPLVVEPKHYETFKYLLSIRETSFGNVPLDDCEREFWTRAVLDRNWDLVLLSYETTRFRFMDIERIESMLLELLPAHEPLVAKKANYLFKRLIEASVFEPDLMHLCLLNESLDERQSHLIGANLRLLPKLKNLPLKWNVCLVKKLFGLELSSIVVLVEVFKYFAENFTQEELAELFREGDLFNVLNTNPQLFQRRELIELLNRIVQELHFDSSFSFNNYEKTLLNSITLVRNWNPICFLALFLLFFQYERLSKFHILMLNMVADIPVRQIRDFCLQFVVDNCNFCYSDVASAKSIAQLCFRSLRQTKNVKYTLEFLKYQTKRFETLASLKIFTNLLELIEAEYPDVDLKTHLFEIELPALFFDYVERVSENRLGDACPAAQFDYFPFCLKVFVLCFRDYLVETKTFYKFETVLQTETIDECVSERIGRYKALLDENEFDAGDFANNHLFMNVYFEHFARYKVDNVRCHVDYLIRPMLHLNETRLERRVEAVLRLMRDYHRQHSYAILYPHKLKCLNHFLRMIETNFKSVCFVDIAVGYFERESAAGKYYENSTVHRNLVRIMQLLFVYFKAISVRDKIYEFCFRELLKNKHFESVTYYMYAIVSQYPYADLPDRLLADAKHFVMLAYFASRLNPRSFKSHYFVRTTKMIAYPKFGIRSLAISLLATYYASVAVEPASPEYLIKLMVAKAVRDYDIHVDRFFECYDESQLYSLDNVFYHVPRLFGMNETDCIPVELVTEQGDNLQFMQVQKPNNKFNALEPKRGKGSGTAHDDLSQFEQQLVAFNSTTLVQRKPEMRVAKRVDGDGDGDGDGDDIQEGLIVVGSLIDTSANLGGLCRTCHIFGASQLVLANKNVCGQNQLFKSLSMTAENWISIREVKPDQQLCDFLRAKKNQNFRIVGVEQTSNSRKLNEFKFERNTVLVVGNEKRGIPPTVLNVLDDCVEIPQGGLIPSLNVHVAASICIWEYFKQQP